MELNPFKSNSEMTISRTPVHFEATCPECEEEQTVSRVSNLTPTKHRCPDCGTWFNFWIRSDGNRTSKVGH